MDEIVHSEYYPDEYSQLYAALAKGEQARLLVVKSGFGMGKSRLIESVVSALAEPYLKIEPMYGEADALSPMRNALQVFLAQEKLTLSNKEPLSAYQDNLKQIFLTLASQVRNLILWLDDVSLFKDSSTLAFLNDVISSVMLFKEKYPIRMIVECSEDSLSTPQKDLLYDISSLARLEDIIRLHTPSHEQLILYVDSLLERPHKISTHSVDRIIKSGFENLRYIKRVIECLKDMDTLYFQEDVWHCSDIDTERLYQYLKQHIQIRYDKLTLDLKTVLQKASITGFEIDINLLRKPFGILRAEEKLQKIELISRLIEHEPIYRFESDEVFYFTLQEISDEQRMDLYKTAAVFMEKNLSACETKTELFSLRQSYYAMANYNKSCNDYQQAFAYYLKCAIVSFILRDYKTTDKCCTSAFELEDVLSLHIYVQQTLRFLAANAKQGIGEFADAVTLWSDMLNIQGGRSQLYDVQLIKYQRAYCRRRAGNVIEAYQELELLKEFLKPKQSELLADVLIVLTGIVDQLGRRDDKSRYYNWSLDICQHLSDHSRYYRLLGKSNMFYVAGIALPKMKEAFSYFNKTGDRIETGKISYNIGMSSIQNSQFAEATEYLRYALEIFSSCGSRNASYVYCAQGILHGLLEEYEKAKTCFEQTVIMSTNTFAKLTAELDIFYCLQKLNRQTEAKELLNKCETYLKKNGKDKLVLLRNLYFAKAMLAWAEADVKSTYCFVCTAYEIETAKLHYHTYNIYLARWIKKLEKMLLIETSQEICQIAAKHLTAYKQRCYDQKVMWGNLMFW